MTPRRITESYSYYSQDPETSCWRLQARGGVKKHFLAGFLVKIKVKK